MNLYHKERYILNGLIFFLTNYTKQKQLKSAQFKNFNIFYIIIGPNKTAANQNNANVFLLVGDTKTITKLLCQSLLVFLETILIDFKFVLFQSPVNFVLNIKIQILFITLIYINSTIKKY